MPNRILKLQTVKKNPISFLALGNDLSFRDRNGTGTLTASGALRYAPGNGGRVNLATQPSFETGVGQASSRGSSVLAQSTVKALFGSNSLKVDLAAISDSGVNTLGRGPANSATIGETWTVSFYVWSDITRTIKCGIEEWSSTPGYLTGLYSDRVVNAGQWTRISNTKTLGNDNVNRVAAMFYTTDGLGGTLYIDGVLIEKSASASTYFDGTSPGCAWADPITGIAGTAHASPSISKAAFWVEEATTNLVADPSFENAALTAVVAGAGLTLNTDVVKDSSYARFGSGSCKVTTKGVNANEGINHSTNTGLGYTGSARTFIGSTYLRGMGDIGISTLVVYSDTSTQMSPAIGVNLSDSWQRYVANPVTLDPAKTVSYIAVWIRNLNTTVTTFWIDGSQIEEKAYATSYCDGSLGTGYSWSGTAHASASTRAAGAVNVNAQNRVNSAAGSWVMTFRRDVGIGVTRYVVFGGGLQPGDDALGIRFNGSALAIHSFLAGSGNGTYTFSSPPPVGNWATVYEGWDIAIIEGWLNDGQSVSGARAGATGTFSGGNITIGNFAGAQLMGEIGPFAMFDRRLSQAELVKLAATDPTQWWNALA